MKAVRVSEHGGLDRLVYGDVPEPDMGADLLVKCRIEAGRLRPVVDRVLPLSEAREAQRLIEAREVCGKLVLVP